VCHGLLRGYEQFPSRIKVEDIEFNGHELLLYKQDPESNWESSYILNNEVQLLTTSEYMTMLIISSGMSDSSLTMEQWLPAPTIGNIMLRLALPEAPAIQYVDAMSQSYWQIITGKYANNAYVPTQNSGWDTNYGYGWISLRRNSGFLDTETYTKLKVYVDFQANMYAYSPGQAYITVKVVNNQSYEEVLNTTTAAGVQTGNVFEFDFDLVGEDIWEVRINPAIDARIYGIELGY